MLRNTPYGEEVMIVYRKRYQEWTLPKGKLKEGESFQEAAVREVQEETGCSCQLGSYVGTISYARQDVPKVVMFWRMSVLEEDSPADTDEITRAVWLPVSAALQRLTHAQERSLLARLGATARPAPGSPDRAGFARVGVEAPTQQPETQNAAAEATKPEAEVALPPASAASAGASPALGSRDTVESVGTSARALHESVEAPRPAPTPVAPWPTGKTEIPLLPAPPASSLKGDHAEVARDVAAVRIELDYLVRRAEQQGASSAPSWSIATLQHIVNAEQALAIADVEGARRDLHRARRYVVFGLNQGELRTRVQILRGEATGSTSWRALAIEKLLALPDDQLTAARLAEAMGLRDDDEAHEKDKDHHILRHIQGLGLMCLLAALVTLSLLISGVAREIASPVFMAMIGAALSAALVLSRRRRGAPAPTVYSTVLTVVLGAASGLAASPIADSITAIFKLRLQPAWLPLATALLLGFVAQVLLSRFTVETRDTAVR